MLSCLQVARHDTLSSIAAQFDMSLSELKTLNRLLGNATVFPGQILYVPDKQLSSGDSEGSSLAPTPTEEKDKPFLLPPPSQSALSTAAVGASAAPSSTDTDLMVSV